MRGVKIKTQNKARIVSTPFSRVEMALLHEFIDSHASMADGTLRIGNSIQVQSWERVAQEKMADHACALHPIRLLELGYGLGMASKRILEHSPIERYVSTEIHPDIAYRAINALRDVESAHIIQGAWQTTIGFLRTEYFTGIINDAYLPFGSHYAQAPYNPRDLKNYITGSAAHLAPLLISGGRLVYLDVSAAVSFESKEVSVLGFKSLNKIPVQVDIPESCCYATGDLVHILVFEK